MNRLMTLLFVFACAVALVAERQAMAQAPAPRTLEQCEADLSKWQEALTTEQGEAGRWKSAYADVAAQLMALRKQIAADKAAAEKKPAPAPDAPKKETKPDAGAAVPRP